MVAAPDTGPAGPASAAAPAPPSLQDSLQALLRELPGLLSDRVELLSLELHRAGLALSQIVALVLVAALLAATAWLALCGLVVGLLVVALGLHWAAALALVLLVNLAAAGLALARVRRLTCLLSLPATKRHLMLNPPNPARPAAPAPSRDASAGNAPA